jgi:hypothetical protein
MKHLTFRFNFQGIIRIALLVFLLSSIINLFGVPSEFSECPVNFDYTCEPLDLSWNVGSRFLFRYTISIDKTRVTEFDKQRTYRIESEFLSKAKNYGSFRTLSTDIQSGQIFRYEQFPIKGNLKIKYYGGVGAPFFDINVIGNAVKGDSGTALSRGDFSVQQVSQLAMAIIQEEDYPVNLEHLRIAIIIFIPIALFSIIILIWRWRKRSKTNKPSS